LVKIHINLIKLCGFSVDLVDFTVEINNARYHIWVRATTKINFSLHCTNRELNTCNYASICFKWLKDELIATIMIFKGLKCNEVFSYKIALLRASTLVWSLSFKTRYLIGISNVKKIKSSLKTPILSGPHTTFQQNNHYLSCFCCF